jgi:outer membrane protein assembly factor BamD
MIFRSARFGVALALALIFGGAIFVPVMRAQQTASDSLPAQQRLDIMRSRLESLRRSLQSAVSGMGGEEKTDKKKGKDKDAASADDPRVRLQGLDKEAAKLLSDVNDLRTKQERAEKYDRERIDQLEAATAELDARAQDVLRSVVRANRVTDPDKSRKVITSSGEEKKGGGLLGIGKIFHGGNRTDKYGELTSTVAPGRDRELFNEARKEAHKGHYEEARYLFNVIITTYPESPYLPAAKLAVADTFYREGTTSALVQAGAGYKEWLTFFPTDPLADRVLLKTAEVEMRQMGLPDRESQHARKAEQILKAFLQQHPNSPLRPDIEERLKQVQENLALHNMYIGNFYYERFQQGKANNPKGAQSRYLEIVQKYPNFSMMDFVLFRLGTTYMLEEEPDEAGKYFQQLARNYPNSEYLDKAKDQLATIGLPVPEPDPTRKNLPPPEKLSFTQNMIQQLLGRAAVTVTKDGVLISEDGKDDLLDKIADSGGQTPVTTPDAPVQRSNQPVAPTTQPRATPKGQSYNPQP